MELIGIQKIFSKKPVCSSADPSKIILMKTMFIEQLAFRKIFLKVYNCGTQENILKNSLHQKISSSNPRFLAFIVLRKILSKFLDCCFANFSKTVLKKSTFEGQLFLRKIFFKNLRLWLSQSFQKYPQKSNLWLRKYPYYRWVFFFNEEMAEKKFVRIFSRTLKIPNGFILEMCFSEMK